MTIEINQSHCSWTSVWYSRLVVRHIAAGLLAIAVFAFHPGDSRNSKLSAQEQPGALSATQTAASADGQTPRKSASIAVRRMESARQMLEAQVTGKSVQQLQRQIVRRTRRKTSRGRNKPPRQRRRRTAIRHRPRRQMPARLRTPLNRTSSRKTPRIERTRKLKPKRNFKNASG